MFCKDCGAPLDKNGKCPNCSPKTAKKKKSKKGIIAFIVAVIIIAAGCGIGAGVYLNSDGYKMQQAVKLIDGKDYYGAKELLSDIDTDEAVTLKNYLNVLFARSAFCDAFSANTDPLITVGKKTLLDSADSFSAVVYSFGVNNDVNLLPDSLHLQYDNFKNAVTAVDIIENKELYKNAQEVFLDKVIMNTAENYTLAQLKQKADISRNSVAALSDYYAGIANPLSGGGQYVDLKKLPVLNRELERFSASCESEISYIDRMIQKDTEENGFGLDDLLYHKNSVPDYKGKVMDGLNEITDEDDISYNADIMQNTLKIHLLYYFVS